MEKLIPYYIHLFKKKIVLKFLILLIYIYIINLDININVTSSLLNSNKLINILMK